MHRMTLPVVLFLVALGGAAAGEEAKGKRPTFPKVDAQNATVGIKYHEFVVLKCDDQVLALYVMPDPRYGWDGINYRWYQLTDGSDKFFQPSPAKSDASPNNSVKTGAGDTDERGDGTGNISIGPVDVQWSKGNQRSGWLYVSHLRDRVFVYPQQFKRLEDFSGKLDHSKWLPLQGEKAANDR